MTTNKLNELPPLFGKFTQDLVQSLTVNAPPPPKPGNSSPELENPPKFPLPLASVPIMVTKTKPAVVEIVATDKNGSPTTLGTGFFVSSDGLLVTNFHVIEGATSLTAVSTNGAIFLFRSIVAHPAGVDIAILKFQAHDVPFLRLGGSTKKVEGERVIDIGNPTGLFGSVSDGIISAFRENRSMIQITAPISPGSSGSPVLDESGSVIGVATLTSVEGQNLNFAIAVEKVSAALASSTDERTQAPRGSLPQSTATPYHLAPILGSPRAQLVKPQASFITPMEP